MQPRTHCLMSKPMPFAMRMNWGAQEGLTFNLCLVTFANVLVIMSSYFCGEMSAILVPRPVGTRKKRWKFSTPISSASDIMSVSYTHLRAHETDSYLVCRLLLE